MRHLVFKPCVNVNVFKCSIFVVVLLTGSGVRMATVSTPAGCVMATMTVWEMTPLTRMTVQLT